MGQKSIKKWPEIDKKVGPEIDKFIDFWEPPKSQKSARKRIFFTFPGGYTENLILSQKFWPLFHEFQLFIEIYTPRNR